MLVRTETAPQGSEREGDTGCLEEVQELDPLGELGDFDECLLHVAAGSTHHAHGQEQIVHLEEFGRQPDKRKISK